MKLSEEIKGHSLYVTRVEIKNWYKRAKELEEENEKLKDELQSINEFLAGRDI